MGNSRYINDRIRKGLRKQVSTRLFWGFFSPTFSEKIPRKKDLRSVSPRLWIVSTPIGNLKDITLRALEVLKEVEGILCEDTRVTRKLLSHYGISKPLFPYHDHNAERVRGQVVQNLLEGKVLALVSDAGTPLVSDPGYKLIQACRAHHIPLSVVPGPSAPLAALVLSGLPTDSFFFGGFADPRKFQTFREIPGTLLFFESASRLSKTLTQMAEVFAGRLVAVVREITKIYEEVQSGTFEELIKLYETQGPPRGEIVIVLGPPPNVEMAEEEIEASLKELMKSHSLKDAVDGVAAAFKVHKKKVYQLALKIKG